MTNQLTPEEVERIKREVGNFYNMFFGTGYWEEQYKPHIIEYAKQLIEKERQRAKVLVEALKKVRIAYNFIDIGRIAKQALTSYNNE